MKRLRLWLVWIIWLIGLSSFCSAWYFSFSSTDLNGYYKHNFYSYGANTLYQIYGCSIPANCVYSVYIHTWNDYKRFVYTSDQLNAAANWNNYINIIWSSCNTRINCSNGAQEFLNYTLAPACPDSLYVSYGWNIETYNLSWSSNTLYLDSNLLFSTWFDDWYQFYVSAPVCEATWDNWSALYINEIQHESAPLISITIPEEFDWDYSWTEEEFDLDIKWFNVDTEYIDWIITTQKTLPNNTDFNNTISWLIPIFIPWLVIIIFLLFIFRFIKKIF